MLTSINPLGERIRGNRWVITVAWLVAGGIVGGALLGAACGGFGVLLAGSPSSTARVWILVVALSGAAAWDLLDRRFPGRRQVDENWLTRYRSWVYGFGFGTQLGVGLATVVNTATVPAMMTAMILVDSVPTATLIGVVFGATRGITVLLSGAVRTPDDLRDLHRRIDRYDASIRRIGALSSLGMGVIAAAIVGS